MKYEEQALRFECEGQSMYGVLSRPQEACSRAVLIVVGGPQYRVGSHRQFALLARSLAAQGIAALRFDYRGMGDSEGEARSFESVDADLRSAIDALLGAVPGTTEVVIWGLCDAASAALFYAAKDSRVAGLVLLNPWVRTTEGHAKATIKHYYRQRLLEPALWKKIFSGRFDYSGAARSFARLVGASRGKPAASEGSGGAASAGSGGGTLPERMLGGLTQFKGKILLIMSGADLTAQEFSEVVKASPPWQRQLAAPRVAQQALSSADHTFSRRVWRDQVADWTAQWVKSW